jgi:SAM-dependent methyltransferase
MFPVDDDSFVRTANGVLTPRTPINHRADEYDPLGFKILRDMQERHFWYRGRHRFLLHAVRGALAALQRETDQAPRAIDLGGGCGGWIAYLQAKQPGGFAELALADSSRDALEYAGHVVGANVNRYQIDLLNLPWSNRWDVAFLLDVLEHIPDDVAVVQQVRRALRPGGWLLVTTPAFNCLRTYNDDLVHHVRRYVHRDFVRLAQLTGLQLRSTRYFMFLLSPLLMLSRLKAPKIADMTQEQIAAHLRKVHRVPSRPVNALLEFVFSLETPLGAWLPFPWGTSILGVFQKPATPQAEPGVPSHAA